MEFNEVCNLVADRLGFDSYRKGRNYYKGFIGKLSVYPLSNGAKYYGARVESERTYTRYSVYIGAKNSNLMDFSCECLRYNEYGTCKHIAAVLLNHYEEIFAKPKDAYQVTEEFLNSFKTVTKAENTIKEQLKLELTLDLSTDKVTFKPYVGLKKVYTINNESKFKDFMEAFKNGNKYTFGVNFTYNPSKHFFSEEDSWLLNFLYNYDKGNYYSYNRPKPFELNNRERDILFDKLKTREFKVIGYGLVKKIEYGLPTSLNLYLDNEDYRLNVQELDKYTFLDRHYKYVAYNKVLYIIPDIYVKLLNTIKDNDIEYLTFKKDQVDNFKNGLLREIKDNITIDEKITDIVISGKPSISLYFDMQKDKVKCDIKLKYKNITIDYFDKNDDILRDEETELEVINDLLKYNFEITKNHIFLTELDDIGAFITEGLIKLKEKYDIFTSKKLDSINIHDKSNIKSNFSIGMGGIMSYEFSIDNIDSKEVGNIINSLKINKRYYKLKNGDLINLEENEELKEFSNVLKDLEINVKDLGDGTIEIPKYRAFYIDSLKQNKYKSINTSNSFDNFINNFNKYKNIKIVLDKEDEKTLRNYQKDGVKWLYTLYKCDLGGILADEMGLGKSIQTICFIKQVLKEKKDAKILIVCPTALVYNWVKEFDKFGSELKYVAVAENKEKRKQVINDFDKYNIFITSYRLIRNDNDEYEDKEFELCIIDEAQAIKNYQAGMTKEVKKIKARTKIALTGTPLENSIMELWSIFDFIMPGYLNSVTKFREKYGIKDVDKDSLEKLKLLNYQIKPFILRRKKMEVSRDLPEKIENNIYLELPEQQKIVYIKELDETKKKMDELIATRGFQNAKFEILKLITKLRQICIDPTNIYLNYKGESIKIEKLIEIVKTYTMEGHKILIFSSFKSILLKLEKRFKKEKITNYMITGDTKGKERTELVDKFNKDDTNCFLITLGAGGVGLNLTGADIVIHLDIWWNPQVENQATDRAHRIGQKKKVTVIKLITKGTIEERILELQNKKKILSDSLIEGKDDATIINSISEEEMHDLLSYGDDDKD